MNRYCSLALGLAGASMLLPPAVQAQSSVTLSGIVDLAARTVRNEGVGNVQSLASGGNSTSRLIVRGTEDLGGGLAAGFHLEHGIAADTGSAIQATQFWDRRSTLSLSSKAWGEIRAGRDFVPSYTGWSRFDPFSYVGVAGSNNLITASQGGPIRAAFGTSPNTTVRSSNALQYLLPAGLGGLEGGLMVAAGEGASAAAGQHKVIGARLGWAGGPVGVSLAHTRSENDLTGDDRFEDTAAGGSYDFGVVKLSAAWRRFELGDARQVNILVGAVVPVGRGEIKLSWTQARLSGSFEGAGIGDNDARQLGLGYVHGLSKRTALYATVSRLDNKGAATFVVPGGPGGLAGGDSSTGAEIGLRHNF